MKKLFYLFIPLMFGISIQQSNAQMPTYNSMIEQQTQRQNELRDSNYGMPTYNNQSTNTSTNYSNTNRYQTIKPRVQQQQQQNVSDRTGFNTGYEKGYRNGYCYNETTPCNPIVMGIPIPPDHIYTFENGYNRGFLDGINNRE